MFEDNWAISLVISFHQFGVYHNTIQLYPEFPSSSPKWNQSAINCKQKKIEKTVQKQSDLKTCNFHNCKKKVHAKRSGKKKKTSLLLGIELRTAGFQIMCPTVYAKHTLYSMAKVFTCGLHVVNKTNFCLHPCTNHAVSDERQQLETSFKNDVILEWWALHLALKPLQYVHCFARLSSDIKAV